MAIQIPTITSIDPADVAVLKAMIREWQGSRVNSQLRYHEEGQHQAPEVYVALPQTGITALTPGTGTATGDSAGSGVCDVYQINQSDNTLESIGKSVDVYNLSTTAIGLGWIPVFRDKFGRWLCVASDVTGGGGSSGSGCGCCNGFNCLSGTDASVGSCPSAPDGAGDEYDIDMGPSVIYPDLYGVKKFNYGRYICAGGAGYPSGTALISGTIGDCQWFTCPFDLVGHGSGTSLVIGTYMWVMDFSTVPEEIVLVFLSGVDFLDS